MKNTPYKKNMECTVYANPSTENLVFPIMQMLASMLSIQTLIFFQENFEDKTAGLFILCAASAFAKFA